MGTSRLMTTSMHFGQKRFQRWESCGKNLKSRTIMDQAEPLNVLRTPDLDFIEQTTILPNKLYSNNTSKTY